MTNRESLIKNFVGLGHVDGVVLCVVQHAHGADHKSLNFFNVMKDVNLNKVLGHKKLMDLIKLKKLKNLAKIAWEGIGTLKY